MTDDLRVFVSSTSEDLKAHRAAARDVVADLGWGYVGMEHFGTDPDPITVACRRRVDECDIVVLLQAFRQGWVPDQEEGGDGKSSITAYEVRAADELGKPVLAFLAKDTWPGNLWENEQAARAWVTNFRAGLNRMAQFFEPEGETLVSFRALLRQELVKHKERVLSGRAASKGAIEEPDQEAYFEMQRYLIDKHAKGFVQRSDVEAALDEFLATNDRGYFIIRGAPGQGKTAFACNLVSQRDLAHHLVSRTGGQGDPRLMVLSLLAQIRTRGGYEIRPFATLPELEKIFQDSLARNATTGSPLVVVIDAIDELLSDEFPFLVSDALPEGVYFVVTSRPGRRLDRFLELLFSVPKSLYDLGPLRLTEMQEILRRRVPGLSDKQIERVAEAAQGNPLYLRAVANELVRNPSFDHSTLPATIEEYFGSATRSLRSADDSLLLSGLGLLAVARKPLSLAEISQITSAGQRQLSEKAIGPVQAFLIEIAGGYTFFHSRFHEFVMAEVLFEDEIQGYHRLLAEWLQQPRCPDSEYRLGSLAYHLLEAGDLDGVAEHIDQAFLNEKVVRHGYAVLEDVEILTRTLLDVGEPALVERCVAIVEELRQIAGGDLITETTRTIRGHRSGPDSFRRDLIEPSLPPVRGFDLYLGMLPKVAVSADFYEMVPLQDGLALVIGDVPASGLKSAFVARFLANLIQREIETARPLDLGKILDDLDAKVSPHEYFRRVSVQCVEIDLRKKVLKLASAGHPFPVLYSSRRKKCDLLPVRGELLSSGAIEIRRAPYWPRSVEFDGGDVLVLISDGLLDSSLLDGDPYGYRFVSLVEAKAGGSAREIGEAILDEWLIHPRQEDLGDDVTVIVAAFHPETRRDRFR